MLDLIVTVTRSGAIWLYTTNGPSGEPWRVRSFRTMPSNTTSIRSIVYPERDAVIIPEIDFGEMSFKMMFAHGT
jgi:hypothetical protein